MPFAIPGISFFFAGKKSTDFDCLVSFWLNENA